MILESDIAKGLKSGQDAAYKYLYEHFYKLLCAVAFEYVNDTLASEMIVSDVIFAVWQNRETLEINTSLKNYLIRSVRNRSLNYLAQSERQHRLRHDVGNRIEKEQAEQYIDTSNPLSQLIEKELEQNINASIEALPEQTRRIFCMSRFDKMKYEEIAHETGVSVDVVKYHIKSALAQLRVSLKDYLTILLVFLSSNIN